MIGPVPPAVRSTNAGLSVDETTLNPADHTTPYQGISSYLEVMQVLGKLRTNASTIVARSSTIGSQPIGSGNRLVSVSRISLVSLAQLRRMLARACLSFHDLH